MDVRPDRAGSADPGHGARVRRDADATRGGGRACRRHPAQGADGRASSPRNRIGPVRDQYAGVGRRPRLHRAAAGAGAGTVRAGDQWAGLGDGDAAAVVGRGGHRLPARAVAAAVGARREARGVCDHRGVRRLRRVRAADHRAPRRRRVRHQRRQVARHVVQPRRLRLRRGGATIGEHAATTCCSSSTCRGRAWKWFARRTIRTTSPTSTRSWRSTTCGCPRPTLSGPRADR